MLSVLRMVPWWRGPVLLLRRPGVLTGLVAASFVAALPAAAAAPFVSSARNATLAHRIHDSCATRVGAFATKGLVVPSRRQLETADAEPFSPAAIDRTVASWQGRLGTGPGFAPADVTLVSTALLTTIPEPTPATPAQIRLVSRAGFEDHVTVVNGPRGPGVWVPDDWAAVTGIKVGSTITIKYGDIEPGGFGQLMVNSLEGTTSVRVAAVYRDLRDSPDQPYWCGYKDVYRGSLDAQFSSGGVPPVVLADRATFLAGVTGQKLSPLVVPAHINVAFPLSDPHLSLESAQALVPRVDRLAAAGCAPVPTAPPCSSSWACH